MPGFDVEIPHSLPPEEVRTRLDRARSKLETDYGVSCSWDERGDLLVQRKGLDGRVKVEPSRLTVNVKLGLLLAPLSGTIREGITNKLTKLMTPDGA